MQRPFLLFLAALISGIITGNYLPLQTSILMICFLPLLILLLLGVLRKKSLLIILTVMTILFIQGSLNMNLLDHSSDQSPILTQDGSQKRYVVIEGIICESPQYTPEKTHVVLQLNRVLINGIYYSISERVLLTLNGRHLLEYGDFIRCETRLRKPKNFNNPGGFDYERRLCFEGISFLGFIDDSSRIIVLRQGQGNALKKVLEGFRSQIRELIIRNSPSPEQTLIQAMILGNQKEIPLSIIEKFNMTGTSHIIAISGFNVGMIALWTIMVIRLIFKMSEYLMLRFNIIKLSLLSAFLPVIFYTLIAGAGMSVLRAAIMALVFMTATLLDRQQDMINSLAAVAVLILILSPEALFDISFQLSFAAVAAILWINPLLSSFYKNTEISSESSPKGIWFNNIKGKFLLFLLTTVSATLGTLPIIAVYFNRLSLIVLPANVVLVPILGLMALPISMMVIAVSPLSDVLAGLLIHCSAWLVKISLHLVDYLAGLPCAAFYVCTPSLWQIAAFYILLIYSVSLIQAYQKDPQPEPGRKKRRLWLVLIVILTFLSVGYVWQHYRQINRRELMVTAIDVHQGNSTLVRFPGGKTLLVDGGGLASEGFDIGRSVVAPFLWHEGIRKIDIVVLSHAHTDHLGGLLFILENFHVQEVWSNGESVDNETYRRFLEIISRKGIHHRILTERKTELRIGKVGMQLFNPGTLDHSGRNLNEKSLVIRLTFGKVSLMLPGDIPAEGENHLLVDRFDLRSEVLFVPHHGSRMSSSITFLQKVRPQVAVISCGPDNSFGFPHQELIERYRSIGARIFRTDRQGAITVSTDGKRIFAQGFKK